MSAEWELQEALLSKLSSNVALNDLIVGIYDDVPQEAMSEDSSLFPFITVGDDSHIAWDTDTETGFETIATIHTWSRHGGKKELKLIQGAIYDALNRQTLNLKTYTLLDVLFDSSDSFVDSDGITRHGVSKFLIRLEA